MKCMIYFRAKVINSNYAGILKIDKIHRNKWTNKVVIQTNKNILATRCDSCYQFQTLNTPTLIRIRMV